MVWKRDRGICAKCGCDAPKEFRLAKFRMRELGAQARALGLNHKEARKYISKNSGGWSLGRSTGWDCDHKLAVVDGGGQCTLDNYQTLCTPCHKVKTKELHQRIFVKTVDKHEKP